MRSRAAVAFVVAGAAVGAIAMTAADVRLASPAPIAMTAERSMGRVPSDPWSPFWKQTSAVDVPLSAQNLTAPKGGRTGLATARAVHDGRKLYVLVEWRDPSRDVGAGGPRRFADQAAIEFPSVAGERVPAFCMGDPQAGVNIWLWKASRQTDTDLGYRDVEAMHPRTVADDYPFADEPTFYPPRALGNVVASQVASPVETLVANVFGSLTAVDGQAATGIGRWRNGTWRVLFRRDLPAPEDGQTTFSIPEATNVALAIWDGARGDRNGQKSVGQFLTLKLSRDTLVSGEGSVRGSWPYVVAGIVVAAFVLGGMVGTYAGLRTAVSGRAR